MDTNENQTSNETVTAKKYTVQDVVSSNISIDMRGSDDWQKKVDKLFEILMASTNNSKAMPAFSFTPFYYVKNGEWYASTWERNKAVCPLDIEV